MNKITVKDGQIMVHELRHMSEAPKDRNISILVYGFTTMEDAYYMPKANKWRTLRRGSVDTKFIAGWRDRVIYKPKETPSCQDAVNMGLKA